MLLFIFTVMIEMIVCAFRGTKKNFLRLFCNLASAAAAAGITYLCHLIYSRTFGDLTGADLTLEGNLTEETASAVDTVITSFAKGIALSVIFVVLYLLLKYVSLLIVKITVKDKAQRGFKPLGLLFGLVIGIICAGFVLMPLTGLQQVFPDRKTAIKVSDFISENVDEPTGKFVRFFSGPTAQVICKYTGIGLLTNEMFNFLTTAETDSGKECLAEFLPPYFEVLDEVEVIMDEDELLSAKIGAGAEALDAFSATKLFTEKEKVEILEHVVKYNVPELDALPEYKNISRVAEDISCAGKIVGVLEDSVPADVRDSLFDSLSPEDLEISDRAIEEIADNLYSMNAAPFYVNYLLNYILQTEATRVTESNFEATKPAFISLFKTAMKLKELVLEDELDLATFEKALNELHDSPLITESDYRNIIATVRENYGGDDIPDEIFDQLLQ
ncbi:MAG: hypothetical protein IKX80_10530 [Lachnospiraceae bacterium]|nr:hypothetical protein [Lachnospiraceae bacterium]